MGTPRRETVVAIIDGSGEILAASGTPDASPLVGIEPGSIRRVEMVIEEAHDGEAIELETEELRATAVASGSMLNARAR